MSAHIVPGPGPFLHPVSLALSWHPRVTSSVRHLRCCGKKAVNQSIAQTTIKEHPDDRLIFGTLYPAYYSYKAVKSKDIKEYVKWMMYWIIFALFTTAETFTDIFLCWFPFYYELKIAFVAWLLSPYTKGSSLLYRKFVHPTLSSKEKEIDDCLVQAKDRSYDALVHFGKRGLNVAATAAVMAASKVARLFHFIFSLDLREGQVTLLRGVTNSKLIQSGSEARPPALLTSTWSGSEGQGALSERLRSFSMQDLTTIRGDGAPAPSGPPPPGPGRASGKHGQPKMSRSASESASSSGTA
nr:receptor expression-enhancing protein 1 isoform X5 [Macaca nemestrina]